MLHAGECSLAAQGQGSRRTGLSGAFALANTSLDGPPASSHVEAALDEHRSEHCSPWLHEAVREWIRQAAMTAKQDDWAAGVDAHRDVIPKEEATPAEREPQFEADVVHLEAPRHEPHHERAQSDAPEGER